MEVHAILPAVLLLHAAFATPADTTASTRNPNIVILYAKEPARVKELTSLLESIRAKGQVRLVNP